MLIRSIDNPKNFIKSNIFGAYNLLRDVSRSILKSYTKSRLVHVSTDEVYGDVLKGRSE